MSNKFTGRFGDRRDGTLLRDADAMHYIMGLLYPNRTDNEAYIAERVDLEPIKAYLEKKNETAGEFRYTYMHVILTALVKTVTLRPKLNRFYANKNYYQRSKVSAAFVVKKQFSDHAEEGLAFLDAKLSDNIDSIHDDIHRQVNAYRAEKNNSTGDSMELMKKLPRFVSRAAVSVIRLLDKHGLVPQSLIADDPNYSSVFISNLGSIKLHSGYHHLTNWGTNSLFCIIGEKQWTPLYDENGLVKMRETLDLGLTVDERIADGYYFAKSIRLLRHLLRNPELLDKPLEEPVEY